MDGWEGLRRDVRRLLEESPEALMSFPDPESERRERRIRIELAPWATEIAAALDARYETFVELRVGAMTFPERQLFVRAYVPRPAYGLDGIEVELLGPLAVRSGWSAQADVLVTNRGDDEQVLLSNGALGSLLVDSSAAVVGRFVGPQPLVRVGHPVEAHGSRPVPVLIGTASLVPELGYAVPPGQWGLLVGLGTENGSRWSAPLEITVTA
ncbi:hypothetical protein AB0E69_40750 [Kribbella sp. NPDC026611]|uniref:hypothetical protein n=1 Tax=Kribbella sp. NPDC026611 TaxID=3154911 RepID=UPI0033C37642